MNEDIEKASIIIVEMYNVPMHFYQSCACHTALMNHLKAHAAVRCRNNYSASARKLPPLLLRESIGMIHKRCE